MQIQILFRTNAIPLATSKVSVTRIGHSARETARRGCMSSRREGPQRLAEFYLRFYSAFASRIPKPRPSIAHCRLSSTDADTDTDKRAIIREYEETEDSSSQIRGPLRLRRVIALQPHEPKYIREIETDELTETGLGILPHDTYLQSINDKYAELLASGEGDDVAGTLLQDYMKTIVQDKAVVEQLIKEMKEKKQRDETGAFVEVESGPISYGPKKRKVKIIDAEYVDGNVLAINRFNSRLRKILFSRPPSPHVTSKTCYELFTNRTRPNPETFNILIQGFTLLRKTALAHTVFSTMLRLGIEPNEHTVVALLNLTVKSGDQEGFLDVAEMVEKRFLRLIHILPTMEERELAKAQRTEKETKQLKFTIETLIMGHLAFGEARNAMDLIDIYEREFSGDRLSLATQTSFLRYCSERGDYKSGARLWTSMLRTEVLEPDYKIDERAFYWMLRVLTNSPFSNSVGDLLAMAEERGYNPQKLLTGLEKDKGLPLRSKTKVIPNLATSREPWYYEKERDFTSPDDPSAAGDAFVKRMLSNYQDWCKPVDLPSRIRVASGDVPTPQELCGEKLVEDTWRKVVVKRLGNLPVHVLYEVQPELEAYYSRNEELHLRHERQKKERWWDDVLERYKSQVEVYAAEKAALMEQAQNEHPRIRKVHAEERRPPRRY